VVLFRYPKNVVMMQMLITSSSFEFYILSARKGLRHDANADYVEFIRVLHTFRTKGSSSPRGPRGRCKHAVQTFTRISCSAWMAQIEEHIESSGVLTQTRRSYIIILVIKMTGHLKFIDFKDIVVLRD